MRCSSQGVIWWWWCWEWNRCNHLTKAHSLVGHLTETLEVTDTLVETYATGGGGGNINGYNYSRWSQLRGTLVRTIIKHSQLMVIVVNFGRW